MSDSGRCARPAAAMMRTMHPTLPPALNRLVASNLAAQSAEQLSLAAVPIVAVLALGAGAGEIGTLATAQTLPFLLLSIPFGLWADRHSRRRLMVACEALRGLSLLGLLVALLLGRLSLPLLAVLGFVGAVGTVGYSVAAPASALARANARLELARSAAFAAGPALAGALVSWAGGSTAFVLAAMLSAAAVALLWGLPEPARAAPAARHPWAELADGARLVWGNTLLRPILLTAVAWNLSWFVLQAAYVPYAMRALGLDAAGVGLTLAAYGAGMVCGALLAPRVVAWLRFGPAIVFGPVVSLLAMATMVATLAWPQGTLAGLSFFLFGFGPIVWTITSTTLRQTLTPGAMLGRVSALFLTVNMGARPLGAALGGLVGAHWGEAACLGLALAGFALQLAVIAASPVRRMAALPAPAG